MSKVLIVDNSPISYSLQPENALGCLSWFSDPQDDELCERILPMLKDLSVCESVAQWRSGTSLDLVRAPSPVFQFLPVLVQKED